ncbi:hypothetical protein [Rhizorhabdus sp.]|uniref:hypothetical protein n=1 Tax=Rhizorhabdus sp. TaxID=1968843 RepID=UPI0035AFBA80
MTDLFAEGVRAAAAAARFYADENLTLAGDSVLLDPVLSGKGLTPENIAQSEKLQIAGAIHSAAYHAGKHIEANILDLIGEKPVE